MRIYENFLTSRAHYDTYIHFDTGDLPPLITSGLTKQLDNLLHGSSDIKQQRFAEFRWDPLVKRHIEVVMGTIMLDHKILV